jgi:hypothetical protein
MKRNPFLAGLLALLIPGMGHIYIGKISLGAVFLIAFIIVGNLNAIWLSVFAGAKTDLSFYSYELPRLLHDIFAVYGIIFWIWQVVDAVRLTNKPSQE